MNNNEELKLADELKLTEEQMHQIYSKLSDIDKASTDGLDAASKETEEANYTTDDNTIIEANDVLPGVDVIPESAYSEDDIKENKDNFKDILSSYGVSDEDIAKMIDVIESYKAGKISSGLYNKLPDSFKQMCDGIASNTFKTDVYGSSRKNIAAMRNSVAKMLVENFIHDAKFAKAVDDYNVEMSGIISEMNEKYDDMLGNAIDEVFNKIEEIKVENPEKAERVLSIKNAFDSALTFERQIDFATRTSYKKFNKWLNRYEDETFYFNKKVNSNSLGVKFQNIEELLPIIKLALPQYDEDNIKQFIILISKTIGSFDNNELYEVAYTYRMISAIYKYKFIAIDEKGEEIFSNISKAIDAILL
jgi:hypothetical protein